MLLVIGSFDNIITLQINEFHIDFVSCEISILILISFLKIARHTVYFIQKYKTFEFKNNHTKELQVDKRGKLYIIYILFIKIVK